MDAIVTASSPLSQETSFLYFGHFMYLFGFSFGLIFLFTTLLWISYKFHKNGGIIDIGWSFAFLIALLVAYLKGVGAPANKFILTLMVFPWALRLFIHLTYRFVHTKEDVRYRRMREEWGGDPYGIRFLLMFWFQGLLASLIAIPFYLIAEDPVPLIGLLPWVGYMIWLIGFVGETIADYELAVFKAEPKGANKILKTGLWGLCRHPNYFCEWLVWCGIAIVSFSSPMGGLGLLSPMILLYLLMRVSGIPLLENHLQNSRGPEYEEYIQNTPSFFPWPFTQRKKD